jgi:hypothetical protein
VGIPRVLVRVYLGDPAALVFEGCQQQEARLTEKIMRHPLDDLDAVIWRPSTSSLYVER